MVLLGFPGLLKGYSLLHFLPLMSHPCSVKLIVQSQSVTKWLVDSKKSFTLFSFLGVCGNSVHLLKCYLLSSYQKSRWRFARFSKFDVLLAVIRHSQVCVISGIRSVFLVFSVNYGTVYLGIAFSGQHWMYGWRGVDCGLSLRLSL